ncbi:MAG: aminotransferase class V-fold PLP-dependent enzyme [Candidatus Krumholzibacteria bacterium]|jgi:isopenicillin-N epimerase|nr:aminotransferase class V-fold PLP-dependent enzyme [Candidatus Krumholzibacteria bacterium]MDP6669524.1 aminotransferase class V-fold PLP-dependent enzyme [Candidatus Krumholzibacteria bacterium]MDP6797846.1 aminotransferase class V-fold PLP-dependent enzyme [Candidatus Krumholzibacteria bacterium]MDP7022524.1 aminotransferase class V-fold PLP-dependent enzyme [Candidatus Krumholzibacteria bacterium]
MRSLFQIREGIHFLNHGSFGACPLPVFKVYRRWQKELEEQPVEFLGRRAPLLMAESREKLAAFLGTSAGNLVYTSNASTALNTVLKSLRLKPGDEILTSNHEYGAMDLCLDFVAEKTGAKVLRAKLDLPLQSREEVIDAFTDRMSESTRLLFLSHLSSTSALVFPLEELTAHCRERGILTVIDGAHVPGHRPLDLEALGADFYSGNCHKWMLSPKGAAFLYARKEVQSLVEPLVTSWGWRADMNEDSPFVALSHGSRFVMENEWQGTRDISAWLTIPAAIDFMKEHDWPMWQGKCHRRTLEARARLVEIAGLPEICPAHEDWIGQMAAFEIPPCDVIALQKKLYETHGVEVVGIEWENRSFLRFTVQAYNTDADLEAFEKALDCELKGDFQ